MKERWRKLYPGGGKWRELVEGDMEEKVEGCGEKNHKKSDFGVRLS